jgi:hypothetical protein
MARSLEIPLINSPQVLQIQLGDTIYNLRLRYCLTPEGGWIMDINDVNSNPLICGIPLVTGCDLLGQYKYIIPTGMLYCATDGNPPATPSFDNLGTLSHLYYYA